MPASRYSPRMWLFALATRPNIPMPKLTTAQISVPHRAKNFASCARTHFFLSVVSPSHSLSWHWNRLQNITRCKRRVDLHHSRRLRRLWPGIPSASSPDSSSSASFWARAFAEDWADLVDKDYDELQQYLPDLQVDPCTVTPKAENE